MLSQNGYRYSYRPGPFSPRRRKSSQRTSLRSRRGPGLKIYLFFKVKIFVSDSSFFYVFPAPFFTRDPAQLRGERIRTQLVKSMQGLGFTIVGGDDNVEEFLQIKSVVPNGPAWLDAKLKTGNLILNPFFTWIF